MDEKWIDFFNERFKVIEDKLDHLQSFKWRLVGVTIGVSSTFSVAITAIGIYLAMR